ncbi:PTS system, mannose-specific IIA component [Fictibacillus solisalsi]|uniref:PTS system, mannose-specific IIA component n=1 Tax=Fictibacillus solisalsi TaxID=459525 RepID=A0A1H0BKQ6_9BACL|nr:PTS mannose transporter subunit IIA [Fictibacillus solisalsi]SDN46234.1 PTS system, mannose-specific IIA component [Fictibacillus solisalsi]
MKKYLIATHGELSKSFIETAQLIAGDAPNVTYFEMTKLKSGDMAKEELRRILTQKQESEKFIVLTDLFGGSVSNICVELLSELKNFNVVTGVNLPMMLTMILSDEDQSIEDTISEGVQSAKAGIIHLNEMLASQKRSVDVDFVITD